MAPASDPLTAANVPRSQTGSTHTISVEGEGTLLFDPLARTETLMPVVSSGNELGDSWPFGLRRGRSGMSLPPSMVAERGLAGIVQKRSLALFSQQFSPGALEPGSCGQHPQSTPSPS